MLRRCGGTGNGKGPCCPHQATLWEGHNPSPSLQWFLSSSSPTLHLAQDTEDLDHYEMKEEEPAEGKKSEDDGIGKENLAILEKIKKNQRQDYLNVRAFWDEAGLTGRW